MSKNLLPSLDQFRDKAITGLKFITGGNHYTKTDGGTMQLDGQPTDYVADVRKQYGTGREIFGSCSAFQSADAFYSSELFSQWLNDY